LFLKTDGSLWAVGQNGSGQLGDGTYTNRSTSVQVATEVVDAAAGGYQSLYLKADGTAWAMGLNNYGQLGDGSLASRALPVQIASGVSQVAAGYSFSFYIKTDGTLWAMGQNHRGQLGDGTTTNRSVPVQVAIGVASVAAGARHTLFVKTDGSLWGMGYNFFGQLGDSSNTTRLSPVPVATGVASVVAGYYHTLYCKVDGTLWAMGSNFYGILGDGGTLSRNSPVQVASGVTAAAAGIEHSIFLRSDGSAWGMGRNEYGQIGNGTTSARSSPAQIGAGLSTAAAGAYHAVFLKSDGTLWSAGYNGSGRLGDGSYTNRSSLVQVASGVVHLAAGREHSAFLKGDGTLWTVGRNGDGQLGDGTTVDRPTPLQVASDVASVATGDHHTLFVKSDGSLWATGRNSEGRLGDGTTVSRSTPVQVAAGVAAVAGGADHTLFLRNDGTAWSVGSNLRGQLGDGTTTNRASPVQIATGVARIAAGSEHSLLLRSDGSLAGFGYNVYGQLGDGTTTNRLGPITIATGVIDLAGGSYHSLFLKTDGSVWAMGNNSDGALGQLPRIAVKVPTQIASGVVGLSAGGEASFFLLREGAGTAPAITAQPVALSAAFGARVTLSVTASGSSPLDYVWRRTGVELPDFRTATLALPYLQIADAGSYSVTVRNSAGSVTSAEAPVAYTGTTPEGFAYATTGSSMTITDYTGPGGAVSVPATILGQPVIEIGPGVFSGRGDLTAVTLPAGLLRIAANAFRHCTGLTTVTLPASLTTLEGFAFLGCTGLSEIRVTTGNATFSSVDGVLFRGTELLRYPPAKAGTTYAVPAGTTSLAANSFQAAPLSAVSFPVSLTHLEGYPFFQCAQLTALHLPATLTTILHNPAEGSGVLNITVAAENPNYAARDGLLVNKAGTVLLGYPSGRTLATFTVPSGITEIGSRAFRNASAALTTLYLPATLARLSGSAGESGISNAPGLRDLVFLGAPPVVAADYFSGLAASAQALYLPASGAWPATLGGLPTVPMVAPAIVTPPQPQTVPVPGGTVTLSVAASSSPAPSYQWYLNGQLLPGATRATLTLDNVQSAAAGNYRVVVTNPAGSTSSGNAAFQIVQPGNTATQAVAGPGYAAGQPLTIVNQLTYEGTASALSWAVLLPPGWTFASSTAADTSAAPVPGQTDLLEWAWSSIPPSTVEFRYTVNVPAGQTGPRELVALAGVRNGASLQFLAQPDPLVVTEVATHSADVDRNYRISLLELTRVIELYNTRNGTSRTGAYAVAAAVTEDGFEPAPTRLASAVVTLVRYHSGDSNRDGKLGLLELTRVIELYNYRSGTSRTGQYKVKSGTEDGFDPGP
jgi:alpha-tubulin suppressor-like RCC1 family protein